MPADDQPERDAAVPPGFRLRPDPGLLSLDDGTVLLGGSPYRLLRLSDTGAAQIAAWWAGAPVPDSSAAVRLARRLLDIGMAHPDLPADREQLVVPTADEVTVVVPVRDRVTELACCLAGLRDHRVVVVDDGSADPAAVEAVAFAAGARCLHRPVGGGPAAARNTGLAAVDTPLVAFVDSDCVPTPDWLEPLLSHFADPAVAAVAPRIVAHQPGAGWLGRYEEINSALDMGPAGSIVRPGAAVGYLPAAALVVRTAAAGDGFEADLTVGEDVDFVWRLFARGWRVRYEPAATVAHRHRVTLRHWFARRVDYGTSAAALELRHPGMVPALSMSGWSAAAWLAATTRHPGPAVLITGAAAVLLGRRLAAVTADPWPLALRLAGGGTAAAGRLLGSAVTRAWWPAALPAAVAVRRLRLPLAALVLAPPLLDWRGKRPPLDPARYTAARLLDDFAYSIGVWQGCLTKHTARPLLPRLWWRSGTGEPGGPQPAPRSPVGTTGTVGRVQPRYVQYPPRVVREAETGLGEFRRRRRGRCRGGC